MQASKKRTYKKAEMEKDATFWVDFVNNNKADMLSLWIRRTLRSLNAGQIIQTIETPVLHIDLERNLFLAFMGYVWQRYNDPNYPDVSRTMLRVTSCPWCQNLMTGKGKFCTKECFENFRAYKKAEDLKAQIILLQKEIDKAPTPPCFSQNKEETEFLKSFNYDNGEFKEEPEEEESPPGFRMIEEIDENQDVPADNRPA